MVLPTKSAGVFSGLDARLTMPTGFFWYCAPMMTSGAFWSVMALFAV